MSYGTCAFLIWQVRPAIADIGVQRRLFFTLVVACRRRLAKRWEQTPLAKLFTLEDEWSMLKQRAQAVRVREAIKARGLLLHGPPGTGKTLIARQIGKLLPFLLSSLQSTTVCSFSRIFWEYGRNGIGRQDENGQMHSYKFR